MKRRIINNWNFMRFFRLAVGVFLVIFSLHTKEWLFTVIGGLFAYMALLNVGCCGVASCAHEVSKKDMNIEEVSYEEIR